MGVGVERVVVGDGRVVVVFGMVVVGVKLWWGLGGL